MDTLRCPHRAIAALRAAGVTVMERAATVRLARNPVALAYVVVFIYSSLRALPVVFVPGFRGQWWVLYRRESGAGGSFEETGMGRWGMFGMAPYR